VSAGESLGTVGVAATGVGATLLATVSAACCTGPVMAPLVVAVVGAGGAAWVAGLEPYAPYLFAGSLGMLSYAFWNAYRPPGRCNADRGLPPALPKGTAGHPLGGSGRLGRRRRVRPLQQVLAQARDLTGTTVAPCSCVK